MPYKDREKQREYMRRHHAERRGPKYRKQDAARQIIASLRTPCVVCGEDDHIVLHLHHLNPSEKEADVHDMIEKGWSLDRIAAEVAKGVWVCANDHMRIHAGAIVVK